MKKKLQKVTEDKETVEGLRKHPEAGLKTNIYSDRALFTTTSRVQLQNKQKRLKRKGDGGQTAERK